MHYVYILRCADGSLYTGYTTDLERRTKEHEGLLPGGAKYTRGRRPVTVVYSEECSSRKDAQKREIKIKKLSRRAKEELINHPHSFL